MGNGTSLIPMSQPIAGLTANATYHFRAVAQKGSLLPVPGSDQSFTTLAQPPIVGFCSATNITLTTATLNGTANPNGVAGTAWFEWGVSTSYGNATPPQPINGSTDNPVSAALSGLSPGTTYHCRVVAQSNGGTSYGLDGSFTTPLNTGLRNPTANAPETSSAGDNNGYETNPANAHLPDGLNAVDNNSGSGSNNSCTSGAKDKHRFYNYAFTIPSGSTIRGIEVQLKAMVDNNSGSPKICIQLSWDGGVTWTTDKSTPLNTSMTTFSLGNATDIWGRTWSATDFADANFRVRVIDVANNTSRDFFLDWVAVRVHLGTPVPPFMNPTANAAEAGGDGNGYETTPANAHTDDTLNAVDTDSGSGSNSSCTNGNKDKHRFYNYGFTIPSGSTIQGIEVRLDAMVDGQSGSPKICVQLSWDGGVAWTTEKSTPLNTSMTTFILGNATDPWGRTWSANDFSDANFRVRVINVAGNTSRDFFLDWVAVRVHY
jgi:hypothetical protein